MFEFTCLVLSAVVGSITSVYAGTVLGVELSNTQEFNVMIFECAKENMVTVNDFLTAIKLEDVTGVNPCFWTCCLKKAGFLDNNGRYNLEAGLTYAKNLIRRDNAYIILEQVATQCELVPEEKTTCAKGAMIATCFVDQLDRIRFFSKR